MITGLPDLFSACWLLEAVVAMLSVENEAEAARSCLFRREQRRSTLWKAWAYAMPQ